MSNNTRIAWCDATINPVRGCKNNCGYCYANRFNRRQLKGCIADFTVPEFFPEKLEMFNYKKPLSIFCDSMSDIAFWNDAHPQAIDHVLFAISQNPQHNYIFLTKGNLLTGEPAQPFPLRPVISWGGGRKGKNIFNGYSVDCARRLDNYNDAFDFLSIEPLLEPITLPKSTRLRQIIIGAETGNRRGKVTPIKGWIDDIVKQADEYGYAVFMKCDDKHKTLLYIMGADFRQDPLIWDCGGRLNG